MTLSVRSLSVRSWLEEEGIRADVEASAMKAMISWVIRERMKKRSVSVSAFARKLGTSRAAVNRILDEHNTAITLTTLTRAAAALGCRVELRIGR